MQPPKRAAPIGAGRAPSSLSRTLSAGEAPAPPADAAGDDVVTASRSRQALVAAARFALALSAAVALLLFVLARTELGASTLEQVRDRAEPVTLAFALLAMLVGGFYFAALRWRALLPGGAEVSSLWLCAALVGGRLLGTALPGPFAELGASVLLQRHTGLAVGTSLAALLLSHFMGLAASGLQVAMLWMPGLVPIPPEHAMTLGITALFIVLGAGFCGVIALRPDILIALRQRLVRPFEALPGVLGRLVRRVGAMMDAVIEALARSAQRPASAWARCLVHGFLGHAAGALGLWLAAVALGLELSYASVLLAHCAASAGVLVFYVLPGGVLGWDALFVAFVVASSPLSVPAALLLVVIGRLSQLLAIGLGAAALVWSLRR